MYPPIATIGHSTRGLDSFIELLRENRIKWIADVRSIPRSRRNPQFNREALPEVLNVHGIGYSHFASLGGFRKPSPESPNTRWRNASFRGYADYMQTAQFQEALDSFVNLAREKTTAIMCAEALPWRCHRFLIADSLVARGLRVTHILGPGDVMSHRLTEGARVEDGIITYP